MMRRKSLMILTLVHLMRSENCVLTCPRVLETGLLTRLIQNLNQNSLQKMLMTGRV